MSASTIVCFDGFVGLPAQRGEVALAEKFACLGNEWVLQLYTGGDEDADEGMVSIYLHNNMSEKSIRIEFSFIVKDCVKIKMKPRIFEPSG